MADKYIRDGMFIEILTCGERRSRRIKRKIGYFFTACAKTIDKRGKNAIIFTGAGHRKNPGKHRMSGAENCEFFATK